MRLFKLRGNHVPYFLLSATVVLVWLAVLLKDKSISDQSVYAAFEYTAAIGPVALGLGLTLIAGQFDLSVGAMCGFGGILAVLVGGSWETGIIVALGAAVVVGLIQGTLIERLKLKAIPVTLGGLITLSGLGYVIAHDKTVTTTNYQVGIDLKEPIFDVLSLHSLVALACFVAAIGLLRYSRPGRNVYAVGGNEKASRSIGLPAGRTIVGVMIASAMLAALSGAMSAFALASASPENPSNPLFPAVIAVLLGGVRLSGGIGSPSGILAGVLTISVINTGLSILSTPSYVSSLAYGALLLVATIAAAEDRAAMLRGLRRLAEPFKRHPPLGPESSAGDA